ncbi:hypothetical protein LTR84_009047 [Exophiala bonariae]|uniref:Transcription activator GCR1-like domain-containing protein n=1 Tax=Exophiala bonariae TaxID=1690606 RepID=A0AAV9MY61_9EURO|nr:hypothetical protein LTR84_009047 [Exophiala bonariae]
MASPSGSGGQPPRKRPTLFDPARFGNARRPSTLNLTNPIRPAPEVPGQNTYPPARAPAVDPRQRGISLADLRAQQLANLTSDQVTGLLSNSNQRAERQAPAPNRSTSPSFHQPSGSDDDSLFTGEIEPATVETRPPTSNSESSREPNVDNQEQDNDIEEPSIPSQGPSGGQFQPAALEDDEDLYGGEQPPLHRAATVAVREDEDAGDVQGATAQHSSGDVNEELSEYDPDGDSDEGVITYEDVVIYGDEDLSDDGGNDRDAIVQAGRQRRKRRREFEYLMSRDYEEEEDSQDEGQQGVKRPKTSGTSRSPTPPHLQPGIGRPIPESFAEMSLADRVMFDRWENSDRGWSAITHEVNRLTGGNEDNMVIATWYEKIIINTSLEKAYEEVDAEMFLRHGTESQGVGKFWEMRWHLVREEYWELEHLAKEARELRDRWVDLHAAHTLRTHPDYDWTDNRGAQADLVHDQEGSGAELGGEIDEALDGEGEDEFDEEIAGEDEEEYEGKEDKEEGYFF